MTRTLHPYPTVSTPSNVQRAGRHVYTLPVSALSRLAQLADEGTRGHIEVASQAIDLRVDWDGSASSMGHFQVLVGAGEWKACELIDPDELGIDVISLTRAPAGDTFLVRFERGPAHGGHAFGVKAVPIVWTHALPAQLDPSYVAERGKDYDYESGIEPEHIAWTDAVLADGVYKLTLELSMSCDYEMWVRLQDPNDPNNWKIQDPIVRPGHGGGHPTIERDRKVTP